MRLVPWLVAGGLLGGASCALPTVEEYSRGMRPFDGGGVPDAPAPLVDGQAPLDDAGLTSPDADAAAGPCAADYCQSFSTSAGLDDFTEERNLLAGGTAAVQDGVLLTRIPAYAGGDRPEAAIARVLSTTGRKAIVELDMKVDHGDYTGLGGNVAVIVVDMIATKYSNVQFYVGPTGSEMTPLRDDSSFVSDPTSPNIRRAELVHVRLEVDLDPVNGSYTLSFDGKVAASRTGFAFGNPGAGKLRLGLGLHSANPPLPSFDVRYDNIVVDLP